MDVKAVMDVYAAPKIKIPKKIRVNENDMRVPKTTKSFTKNLSWRTARKACMKLIKSRIRSKETYFRLSCHPNTSISVQGIKSIIQNWAMEDWVPDVIVIDYADILNMDHYGLEGRDKINETWKQLRALSQVYHCLVVTASQTNTGAYNTKVITKSNFSEDKRKLAHVTGMIGINSNDEEKQKGISRLKQAICI